VTAPWPEWLARWDRFQEAYVPGRELQFRLIADYLALLRAQSVLDLCAGPGSFGSRLLGELPEARIVAVDHDPWLLELGRRAAPRADGITWIDADLRNEWRAALPAGTFDAVVATTAMQWFDDDEVERIYHDVAYLAPTFVTSDIVPAGSAESRSLAQLATHRQRARGGDHLVDFWADAHAEPVFATLLEERDRRFDGRRPLPGRPLEFHDRALRNAGFSDVTEIWRHGANAILLARRN
jgi:trans-aconitate methyltransferase